MDFKKLLEACHKEGVSDCELALSYQEADTLTMFDGVVEENKYHSVTYGNVRTVVDNKLVSYYVENLDDSNIENIVHALKEEAKIVESSAPAYMYSDLNAVKKEFNSVNDFDDYSKSDKTKYFVTLTNELKSKSKHCRNVRIVFSKEKEKVLLTNSKGLNKSFSRELGYISVGTVVEKDNDIRQAYSFQLLNNFKDIDKEKIYKESLEEALNQIGASSLPSKQYRVVLDNKCMNILIGAFASQFSSEAVLKKMSSMNDKVGQKVFGDNVNLIDDPDKDKFNQVPFDDEGVDTYKKYIVKNGVLQTFMYNLSTSKEMNQKSTGNGFKDNGIKGNVGVRPTNLYLEEGSKELEEVFKDVDYGVYITSFQGAHAGINRASGDFNLQSSGYLIENGKISKPVTLIIVSGNFFDMMNNIVECANDLDFNFGVGSASTYIKSLNISGK